MGVSVSVMCDCVEMPRGRRGFLRRPSLPHFVDDRSFDGLIATGSLETLLPPEFWLVAPRQP